MLAVAAALSGCTSDDRGPPPAQARPSESPRYVPPADRYLSSRLLSFDTAQDAAFVEAVPFRLAPVEVGSGNRALVVAGPTTIKLGSLVRGREFPGAWDLIGLRLRSERGGTVTLALRDAAGAVGEPTRATLTAGAWITLWLETPAASSPTTMATWPTSDTDSLRLDIRPSAPMLVDDLILAQGGIVMADSTIPQSGERWQVRRSGQTWQVRVNDRPVFTLPATPFVPGGYSVVEASPVRVVFRSPNKTISVDRLGRLIENGKARVDAGIRQYAKTQAEDASPARIEIVGSDGADSAGRVERTLPGDVDNDGYDETRGCYTVRASGDRVTVRLSAREAPVRWPVLEVLDLPPGAVSVYVEGQTVPWATRLADGRVIIELPLELERPVEVQVRVK